MEVRLSRKLAESGFVPTPAGHLCSSPLVMGASPSRYLTALGVQLRHLLLEKRGLEFLHFPLIYCNTLEKDEYMKYISISLTSKQY